MYVEIFKTAIIVFISRSNGFDVILTFSIRLNSLILTISFRDFKGKISKLLITVNIRFGLVYGVNTTFNNISLISWWSVLLVEETGIPTKNHSREKSPLSPGQISDALHGKILLNCPPQDKPPLL